MFIKCKHTRLGYNCLRNLGTYLTTSYLLKTLIIINYSCSFPHFVNFIYLRNYSFLHNQFLISCPHDMSLDISLFMLCASANFVHSFFFLIELLFLGEVLFSWLSQFLSLLLVYHCMSCICQHIHFIYNDIH